MSADPWLAEMPAAPCPEGCLVRKDDVLGVVLCNDRRYDWAVVALGVHGVEEDGTDHATPEAAGWRHALDTEQGFGWVLRRVKRGATDTKDWLALAHLRGQGVPADNAPAGVWEAIAIHTHSWLSALATGSAEPTDADRLVVARAFAAVLR